MKCREGDKPRRHKESLINKQSFPSGLWQIFTEQMDEGDGTPWATYEPLSSFDSMSLSIIKLAWKVVVNCHFYFLEKMRSWAKQIRVKEKMVWVDRMQGSPRIPFLSIILNIFFGECTGLIFPFNFSRIGRGKSRMIIVGHLMKASVKYCQRLYLQLYLFQGRSCILFIREVWCFSLGPTRCM